MIEELTLLIPLLQSAGEGIFWIAVMLIFKGLLQVMVVCLTLIIVAHFGLKMVRGNVKRELGEDAALRVLAAKGYCDPDGSFYASDRARLARELPGIKESTCK